MEGFLYHRRLPARGRVGEGTVHTWTIHRSVHEDWNSIAC